MKNKWKMCFRTIAVFMCMFFLVQAGRFKKPGIKHKNFHHIRRNASLNFGLWPSPFNLATKAIIAANATCGENGREEFCRMMEGGKGRCGICDNFGSDPGKKHSIGYAIDGSNRWWQSPALYYGKEYEYVTITIDLKQVYQITDIIIKAANSLRPGTWILEHSINGRDRDYEPWQYFARNDKECLERFAIPGTKGKPHYFTDSEVICTSFYSKLTPMENGEIHTSLINGRPGVNETSPELLQFTKARYVRLRLMGLRGTVEPLPRWFSQDVLKEKRLFYTVRDISVIGYCVCNGHAENCRHNVASGHPECECAHHTCGPNCDKCCPMYNQRQWGPGSSRDAHHCLPCNCHDHATSCHYDENVDKAGLSMDINGNYQGGGVCDNCTVHTTGINCEKCMPGYYRPYGMDILADQPCVKCDCDSPGSLGTCVQEGDDAGKCDCLPGYVGETCGVCEDGYKGWPQCESCPCDPRGTIKMDNCEGNCLCKAHVNGKFCDKCKPGYFALKSASPSGCTQCYCSGVTTICESAPLTPKTIQTLNNWLITDSKISEVVKPIWDNKGLFSIGNYDLPNTNLFWLAPDPYLGNKLDYYGSDLIFKVHWVIMRGDTSGRPTTGPNIIMSGGNGIKIAHGNDFFSTSNETFTITMNENDWYYFYDDPENPKFGLIGEEVSRKQFLAILANISHVLLRATFHTDQIESLLEEATLHSDSGVFDVEKCSCPSGYSGLSCESCAFGYVRITTNTSESYCGKCDCNGHSETCNPDTGECFCQHNTTGENCERCKPGYYGNPLKGTKDGCKKCACPRENDENNFSPSCQLDYLSENNGEGGYVCTQCPKGYTGDHCEICDDGYFGNPMEIGSLCQSCNCNGGPCDKVTGQCLSCKGNTEGWRCEKCKNGYYGDALMSNCMSCQCDPIGSNSIGCDIETGQCDCKERFTERTCNKCEIGYGNVTALCVPCACNGTGSKSTVCDQHTGLCDCKEGVDGFHCDTCQNLHYGFSEDGCKECNCDKYGSKIQACDQNTGKCICKPHYEGPKCDHCEAGYYKSKSICTPCNCDRNGSTSFDCDPETGMCPCKVGVQGQKCDTCQEKHYGDAASGCKACDPCDKEGHICHPESGKCVCPKLTEGEKCESCVENSWGYEPGIGCKPCGCSIAGSSTTQCDTVTGRCTCKLGFEGEKCDKCSFGYYNYPNCRKCSCNVAGTLPEDCSHGICKCSQKGCRCKANVEGQHCDMCKEGTFGMDPDHLFGCIDCFCSGRSNKCTASSYVWDQIRTNDVQQVPSQECVHRANCWTLPSKFAGDLIPSYGGYLRISSNSPKNHVYITGNSITLESLTDPRGDIKFIETYWKLKHIPPDLPEIPQECIFYQLTRPCLMVILQNVSKILIEPRSLPTDLIFSEVLLDKISNTPGIPQAKSVENCICPEEYTSSSCQDPNTGYYRNRPQQSEPQYTYIDRILGVARPCQCHNRSNNCDRETGHCLNCKDFTTGPHCDSCAEGYYKDPEGNCSPCLCPSESQNFAHNCTAQRNNKFICICKMGYSGANCNQCEDKYWGNPLEAGGSCQPCNCNPHGSVNLRCDKLTGVCQCKPGFTGDKCSKCSSPRHVIQDGVCIPCDECTQILFYTIDDLSNSLDNTLDLFQNGLGPPWGSLNSTLTQYNLLTNKFDNIQKAQKLIDDANIPEIENRIQNMKITVPIQDDIVTKQATLIDDLQAETIKESKKVQDLDKNISDLAKNIDGFGKSHIDVHEALRQAKELLSDISGISQETRTTQYYQNFFERCEKFNQEVNEIYKDGLNTTGTRLDLRNLKNRIKQLNEELAQTHRINELAKSKNSRNAQRIEALKRQIRQLDDNNTIINENISKQLRKMAATNDLLQDMEKIHDLLSQVSLGDVATDLDDDDIGEVYETLSAVRDHVKDLQDKIQSYKNIFNFTADEWTKIDASGAYDNIVKGIEKAKNEAEQARNVAMEALKKLYPDDEDSLPDKSNLAKAFSDRIHKRVLNLENLTEDFKRTTDELEDLKHNILMNGKSNNELNSFLRNILKNITDQARDIEKLDKAEKDARNISSLIGSIEQRLKDTNITMQYDLTKSYEKYLNLLSGPEIKGLKDRINETRDQLEKINISLDVTALDKVQDANKNKFNSTKNKLDLMKQQIKSLTDVIQYANERVEAVEYGVNITECQRHYKLKNDILRSVEINFKCDYCLLFNITNSNKEIIEIRYDKDTPGATITWKSQQRNVSCKNTISIMRIGSKIQISTDGDKASITDEKPFEIESKHLLQVGNVKSDNSADACLRKIRLNGQTIGLWKFYRSSGSCSGCNKNNTNNDGLASVFFNGNGYREIQDLNNTRLDPRKLTFRFSFATFDENSLIFLAQDKTNSCSFVALNLKDGFLELNVRHVNDAGVKITSDKKYNNGADTTVEISMNYERGQQTYSLNVLFPTEEVKTRKKLLTNKDVYKIKKSQISVGGISSIFNATCLPINTTGFVGNLNASGALVVNNQNSKSANIEPRLANLEFQKAWFPGNGRLDLEFNLNDVPKNEEFMFTVKPLNVDSSFVMNINNVLDVYLQNSKLVFRLANGREESFAISGATSFHFIQLSAKSIKVNGDNKSFPLGDVIFNGTNHLYLGNHVTNKNYSKFVGSIGDFFAGDRAIMFNAKTVKEFENVEIGRDRLVPQTRKSMKEMQNTERYFSTPHYRTEPQAFKFGDKPNSFVFIRNTALGRRFVLEFQFRTFYPNGLLFISNSIHKNVTFYTILEIQGGDIRLQVQGHKMKVMKITERINDGIWHHVQLEQILGKKKWRLVVKVDKKWKIKDRVNRNSFNGDLYLGGLALMSPVHKKLKYELHPFRGCIRSLKINKNPQVVKNNNNVVYSNIGQCFQNVEEGAYFGGDAYAIYKYGFKVNEYLELSFEFKTGEPNGILLSVSNFGNSPALSVELQNGAVVMTIDMGNGIISQVTNSPHSDATLANNEWHNITALYSSSELTVNVDGIRKSWVQLDVNSMMDEIEAPLYVGGLPGSAPSGTLKIKENFKGCIRKFKIDDNIMDWTDMKKLNNVQLNSCLA